MKSKSFKHHVSTNFIAKKTGYVTRPASNSMEKKIVSHWLFSFNTAEAMFSSSHHDQTQTEI